MLMLIELTFLIPIGGQWSGLEEHLDFRILCVCTHVYVCVHRYTPTARTGSDSVFSLDLGTGTCSSCIPIAGTASAENQTVTSPRPCTSLGKLKHSVQGCVGISALTKFLCHLLLSSWLSPRRDDNRACGT